MAEVVKITSESEWNALLLDSFADRLGPHFLQSFPWGEHKSKHGWLPLRFVVNENAKAIGAFQLLTRVILKKPYLKIAYVPRGPIVREDKNLGTVLEAIEQMGRQENCFYIKADPEFEEGTPAAKRWHETADKNGWRVSGEQIQPRATGITDLLQDDPEGEKKLLAAMSKRWRYNVGLGPKRGITTEAVEGNDFKEFYKIYQETGSRQGFGLRTEEYYQEVADRFSTGMDTSAQLFVARHPEESLPLAGAFLLSYGRRWWYFYGASSVRRRADMPTYALQWNSIRFAREKGGVTYDWWGAPENPENKRDRRYSVWHFKKGFGPRHMLTVGAFDKPLKPFLYKSYMALSSVRRSLL